MVRYFYAWLPVVPVATLVILSLPWLGLIALIVVMPLLLGALAALAWAIVAVPHRVGLAISHQWHGAHAQPHAYPTLLTIDYRTPRLARSTTSTAAETFNGRPDAA